MEFGEVKKIGKYFEPYLSYKGFSLWKIGEAAIYNNFLKNYEKPNFFRKIKGIGERNFINFVTFKRRKERDKKSNKFLIVVNGLTQAKITKIINKNLKGITIIKYESPKENFTKSFFEKEKILYSNLESYFPNNNSKIISEAKKWLKFSWKEIKKDSKLKKFLGENYKPVLNTLEYFCSSRKVFLEYIKIIEAYKKIFKKNSFKVFITYDDVNSYGRIGALIARDFGIKSLCIQHGQLKGNPVGEITCDRMLVNGAWDKNFLVSFGANEKKIKITGQINFDTIQKKLKLVKNRACKKFGLNAKKKIIVFVAQKKSPGESVTQSAKACFLKNIRKLNLNEFEIVLSLREDMDEKKEFPSLPKKIKIIKGGNIQDLISCCDLFLTAYSTSAIEAVLMNKPVITINLEKNKDEYLDYGKEGVGFKITRESDLLPSIKFCLENLRFKKRFKKKRLTFIKKFNYRLDGRALERVIKSIRDII